MKKRLRKKLHRRLFSAACFGFWTIKIADGKAQRQKMIRRPGAYARSIGLPSRFSDRAVHTLRRLLTRWVKAGNPRDRLQQFFHRFGLPVGHKE